MTSSGDAGRWKPVYTITPAIVRHLQSIEAARTAVQLMPLPPSVAVDLRRQARLRSTHYSTRIEGNRLTLAQAEEVIEHKVAIPRRERDVGEVRNYWNALLAVEEMADTASRDSTHSRNITPASWSGTIARWRPIPTTTTTKAGPMST